MSIVGLEDILVCCTMPAIFYKRRWLVRTAIGVRKRIDDIRTLIAVAVIIIDVHCQFMASFRKAMFEIEVGAIAFKIATPFSLPASIIRQGTVCIQVLLVLVLFVSKP